jgi:Fe-S oxidoreductase
MCPSYMATGEEMHSTRGRARLLFEMLKGETLTQGWREPAVKEALDLCLSCKGCRGECPVHVDMATYKAEFLAHYYEGILLPPAAWAFGLVDVWARLASHAPWLANGLSQHEPFAGIAKAAIGIDHRRRIPKFPAQCFTRRFAREAQEPTHGRPVILWADTFNNYFTPEVAVAATEVLRHAGFAVHVPAVHLCCGRPLYEFGMLDRAKRYLHRILDVLAEDIRSGTPIVVLEPACLSVFRDEMPDLLNGDEQAKRLSRQSFLLSEFLEAQAGGGRFGSLQRKALVHAHCHHKAVLGTEAEESLLKRIGLDYRMPDTGCCGMAGSFGFEAEKYDVSMRCAERVLLPEVRAADDQILIVADGFSCREQIAQSTNRRALHLAQVLHMAMKGS